MIILQSEYSDESQLETHILTVSATDPSKSATE